ncbi:MAG: DUF4189 domain-containing protein [Alphaproteobacteria bacterium]|nr:DUF4189 domain-containing protein [Alphaproteobacteria bacterium]MDE1985915.1 DUF4189 domain-containing protein [Alphaproteobacteria bacterium]MDE2163205.1 DUF4189 domain-containing protein [Alphaproteobacteria bacterium]MDE2500653.1 DUF4189 domain-containing protein [Alphaproteobacteria bacterium]
MNKSMGGGVAVYAAAAWFFAASSLAAGALAVGVPPNVASDGFAYGRNVNSPDKDTASTRALALCRSAHDSTDTARNLCTLVMAFEKQCVSVAMDPKAGTPGVGWAVAATKEEANSQALANCRVTAGPTRQDYCVTSDTACDGQ